MNLVWIDGALIKRSGRMAPLLIGVAVRQATSRTAQVEASLSRPGVPPFRPAAPVSGSFLHASALDALVQVPVA